MLDSLCEYTTSRGAEIVLLNCIDYGTGNRTSFSNYKSTFEKICVDTDHLEKGMPIKVLYTVYKSPIGREFKNFKTFSFQVPKTEDALQF